MPGAAAGTALFAMQLGGSANSPMYDQLNSTGTVDLSAATLDLTALAGAGPFNAGQQFVIVQAGAPITTTFDGLPEGSTVSDGTQNFTISYANDRVTLTAQQVSSAVMNFYLNGQAGDNTAPTFVHNLYRELLGREPSAPDQAIWVSEYNQVATTAGSAAAQQTVVAGFLGSPEYREHLVEVMYTNFLHRAADASGLAYWTAELAAGVDEKAVLADILGSDEYFTEAQGRGFHPLGMVIGTEAEASAWVSALYQDLLGRVADTGGLAFWTQQVLNQDTAAGRTAIAFQFLGAPEVEQKLLNGNYPRAAGSVGAPGTPALSVYGEFALADLTGNGWDNLYFQGNLSAAAIDSLFASLQAGASYDETISGMLDMPLYFGM